MTHQLLHPTMRDLMGLMEGIAAQSDRKAYARSRLQSLEPKRDTLTDALDAIMASSAADDAKERFTAHIQEKIDEIDREMDGLIAYLNTDTDRLSLAFEHIAVLRHWFDGWMMFKETDVTLISRVLHEIRDAFPVHDPMMLYRIASFAEKVPGSYARVTAGPKVIQSWTTSRDVALRFFHSQKSNPAKMFVARGGQRHYAVLKARIPAENILLTPETLRDFLNAADYESVDGDTIERIMGYGWQQEVIIETHNRVMAKLEWLT